MAARALLRQTIVLMATLTPGLSMIPARADMIEMTGVEPQHVCAECHGLEGAGNRIKFPRLAGQKAAYIVKQLQDFRAGLRKNDGGQMRDTATELEESDIPRVAEWFSTQEAPWPKQTLEGEFNLEGARKAATIGIGGEPGCLSCHSAAQPYLSDRAIVAPRLAGQYDYYIAKQLMDYRDGRRGDGADDTMRKIARRLTDGDIRSLAVFLSQNPGLHEEAP